MMPDPDFRVLTAWQQFTRLGEAQILLPALLLALLLLWRERKARPLAGWWLGGLAAAALLTTATKVAFIGWGIGWPALDFTGISGHAMFAAAIYPLLLGMLAPARLRWPAVAAGTALALAIGVSRIAVDAHSPSEVVAGLALGGAVSGLALGRAGLLRAGVGLWLPVAALLWFGLTPVLAPRSNTHGMVTKLALALSGHQQPYVRGQWRRGAGPAGGERPGLQAGAASPAACARTEFPAACQARQRQAGPDQSNDAALTRL